MPAPTFVQEAETVWNTATSPKTTTSFSVLANDVLVAFAARENWKTGAAFTISGGSLTWTARQEVQVNNAATGVSIWTAVVDADKSMTVSFGETGGDLTDHFGGNVLTFRGSAGVGNSSKTNGSGGPTLNITTTQANSAIVVCNGDWSATNGSSRTWRTNAGAFTEQTYQLDGTHYASYGGFHADAGAVGTYAVGLSAPTGQTYSIVAVEVKGSAAGGGGGGIFVPRRQVRGGMAPMRGGIAA